jgi:hypothetical protein
MSYTFLMRGPKSDAQVFHGAHSRSPLEIRGQFSMTGPQPVGDGGVPKWVADLFESMPDLKQVALSTDKRGVVWSRLSDESKETP